MNRLWGHFRTITQHRHAVMRHCFRAGIPVNGLLHDLSKYSPTEFFPGVKYYLGTASPTQKERLDKGYSVAWLHHKGRNKHHFEYWVDYKTGTGKCVPVVMPVKYVVEMFCDRVAASKVYLKDKYTDNAALDYFTKNVADYYIHPESSALLESLLRLLAERGEDAAFEKARELVKN